MAAKRLLQREIMHKQPQQDITDRAQVERSLRLRNRAIDASIQGISITDPQLPGNPLVYANKGFERITGYPVSEIIGLKMEFLQGPDTDFETIRELSRAIESEQEYSTEILNYRKDGTPFWNQLSISTGRGASPLNGKMAKRYGSTLSNIIEDHYGRIYSKTIFEPPADPSRGNVTVGRATCAGHLG